MKGATLMAKSLKAMGVENVFFLLGGPMSELVWGCYELGIRFIDVRHEQAAAMMAHGYARVSGKVGVCMTGEGGDTCNATTGVAVANAFCDPLVAIGGSVMMGSREMGAFEEMDQVALMRPITKRAIPVQTVDRIPGLVALAFRTAMANRPGPVYLDLPEDILYGDIADDDPRIKIPTLTSKMGRPAGEPRMVEEAISVLEKAERPIIIAGSGALWSDAGPELKEFVEKSQIPFFTTPLARGIVPDDHPLCFLAARSYAWEKADVALVIGTRANWIVQYLLPPRFAKDIKIIMVNIDAEEMDRNRPVEIGITGDAKMVLRQLTDALPQKYAASSDSRRDWVKALKKVDDEHLASMEPKLNSDEVPIHPLRLCKEIRDQLKRDAILSVDGNETMNFARQSIPTYYPRHRLNIGPAGVIGTGIPFAIGAKVAKPDKQVMAFIGDGSFGINGFEIDSAVRNKINVVFVVYNNGGWGGVPHNWPTGRDLGFTRYDKVAEDLGAAGFYVEQPKDIRPALEAAFAAGKPAVVNVKVNPLKSKTRPFSSAKMAGLRGLGLTRPAAAQKKDGQ